MGGWVGSPHGGLSREGAPALCRHAHTPNGRAPAPARRAVIIDALQKLGMRYRTARQRWAAQVLLATHGAELTRLKAYLDDGGDYHSMYKLVYIELVVGGCAFVCVWGGGHGCSSSSSNRRSSFGGCSQSPRPLTSMPLLPPAPPPSPATARERCRRGCCSTSPARAPR